MQDNEFEYGNIESGEFYITCGTEIHSILPEKRKYVQEIIGLDGVVDYGIGGYGVRVITVPIYFDGDFAFLRAHREQIIAWLSNDGTPKPLRFGNNPDRYYKAKVYSGIEFENAADRHIGDIQFECNPPWQYLLDGTLLTPSEITYLNCDTDVNQFIKEFSEDGNLRLINKGNAVKPIIKLIGNIKSGITLTYGEASFKLNIDVINDGVIIDCQNETVKRISNGESLYGYIDDTINDFFELENGNCEIALSMPGIGNYPKSVTMIVQFDALMGG